MLYAEAHFVEACRESMDFGTIHGGRRPDATTGIARSQGVVSVLTMGYKNGDWLELAR